MYGQARPWSGPHTFGFWPNSISMLTCVSWRVLTTAVLAVRWNQGQPNSVLSWVATASQVRTGDVACLFRETDVALIECRSFYGVSCRYWPSVGRFAVRGTSTHACSGTAPCTYDHTVSRAQMQGEPGIEDWLRGSRADDDAGSDRLMM
jgi:hypothetical protein